jgi:hypothetical protein
MVTEATKQDFFHTLQDECDFSGNREDSDKILLTLVGYYRVLRKLDFEIENGDMSGD